MDNCIQTQSDTSRFLKSDTVLELFLKQVEFGPDRLAVKCGDEELTYFTLKEKALQLALYLKREGVSHGEPVAIAMRRKPEMIVAVVACLMLGSPYVAIDQSYPAERLNMMFGELEYAHVLTRDGCADVLPPHGFKQTLVDQDWDKIAERSREIDSSELGIPDKDDLSYIIFTSGSTGRAKAAAVYNSGWANLMTWFANCFDISPADKVYVISSFSFDITQRSIAMPLVVGGELHLLDSIFYDRDKIEDYISLNEISLINCAPSTFYPLLEGREAIAQKKLKSLRKVFLGGEAISATRLKTWSEIPGNSTELVNVYGAAECSDVSSYYVLKDYAAYEKSSVPIGMCIDNTDIYILNEKLSPVQDGEVGEICIAGKGIGKGYVNDTDLTKQVFVTANLSGQEISIYKTGDLGFWEGAGILKYVGRVDNQVKIRGNRVDLGDVESTLRKSPLVKECIAIKQEYSEGDDRIVLAAIADAPDGKDGVARAVLEFAREHLPVFMVPSEIVFYGDLPLTPNGKLDRQKISVLLNKQLETNNMEISHNLVGLEAEVAEIFSEVLKVECSGVDDNFFDLGGYSILLTEALSIINDEYDAEMTIHEFLSAPTIGGVAERIRSGPS